MFLQLRQTLEKTRFASRCSGILRSPPVALDPHQRLALVSQLQHKDVMMFLLAVKSFAKYVRPGAVFVINDGTLSADDVSLLKAHVPGVTVFEIQQFRRAACPEGGTWERLLAISMLVGHYYVVQLDSDTLTLGPIEEVSDCVRRQRAFVLGTWDHQEHETMQERWETAARLHSTAPLHVQIVAEANFDKLDGFQSMRYVRGCSGFAGFPQRSFGVDFVEAISGQMYAAIGEKWCEWGSEQVMSNIIVANIPDSVVLPHPKYSDCNNLRAETVFAHFIGTCRFLNRTYAELGSEVISRLR